MAKSNSANRGNHLWMAMRAKRRQLPKGKVLFNYELACRLHGRVAAKNMLLATSDSCLEQNDLAIKRVIGNSC